MSRDRSVYTNELRNRNLLIAIEEVLAQIKYTASKAGLVIN
jgi:hypothetical protein